jgi:hypothetical protein
MSFRRARELDRQARSWHGEYRRYDIVKEGVIALAAVLVIVILAAALFSSPDERPSTIAQWATQMPRNFLTTATEELDYSSHLATYGPPYNHGKDSVQHIAFIHLQEWLGISHPINTADAYVLEPLQRIPDDPALSAALSDYLHAAGSTRERWAHAYASALADAHEVLTGSERAVAVPPGPYGPVGQMMSALLADARSGGLDGALLTSHDFYQTDYTKPLLFLADGGLLEARANHEHLLGTQWGMMNETGSYPGQVWLWLYTFWYQIEPIKSSPSADAYVVAIMLVLSLALLLIPFIPGLRDIPRALPLYRLIWRAHYRGQAPPAGEPPRGP